MAFYWRPYVPVAQRRAQTRKKMEQLKKKGVAIEPIEIEGRKIAASFWGKAWCDHLESFSDYENRLPRGRTYVRNGSVCHLEIKKGRIEAMVSGSELYQVTVDIKPIKPALWKSIKKLCSGKIGSMLELLQGQLSDHVMGIVTHRKNGLMPQPGEIKLSCSCPDWADMCKHVAAVMYGVGSRLDIRPELLFMLRGVDAAELISADLTLPASERTAGDRIIADDKLSDVFGIELEEVPVAVTDTPKNHAITPIKAKTTKKNTQGTQRKPAHLARPPKISSPNSPLRYPENMTGNTLILLIAKLGLSVSELANYLHVSPATVYTWRKKRGPLNLHPQTIHALRELEQKISLK